MLVGIRVIYLVHAIAHALMLVSERCKNDAKRVKMNFFNGLRFWTGTLGAAGVKIPDAWKGVLS